MPEPVPVRIAIALDPRLERWAPEIRYVFRTLLRTAGYAWEFRISAADRTGGADIYYGAQASRSRAHVRIRACELDFQTAGDLEPARCPRVEGIPYPIFDPECFDAAAAAPLRVTGGATDGALEFGCDIIFAAWWLLSGARESHYPRDRRDTLRISDSALVRLGLLERPCVSLWARRLRTHLEAAGRTALRLPWDGQPSRAALALSHDVDYPEIVGWIEALRHLAAQGPRGLGDALDLLRGGDQFWRFDDWVGFAEKVGTRPTFFFMARRGSILGHLFSDPDAFYDVRTPRFRELFVRLRRAGCEIALHTSFGAHLEPERFARERCLLEEVSDGPVEGNRHHYWHLDPLAPEQSLRDQQSAGFTWDSSLAFESHPGYRRGICHPFRPFDPRARAELDLVELPPAWMDDHFDRRLAQNGILDPDQCALRLVDVARASGGIVIVDYHVRGMNRALFPRYGAWLERFVCERLGSDVVFQTTGELAAGFRAHATRLEAASCDPEGIAR